MKKRYYLWITILLVIALFVWQKYRIEKYMEGQVKEVLLESSGDRILFDNVSIRLNSLILNDVRVAAGKQFPNIHFGKVKLGFNPYKYVTGNFNMIASVSNVGFADGSITIDPQSFNSDTNQAKDSTQYANPVQLFEEIWNTYGNGQKIELENFDINLDLGSFGIKPLMRNLSGILDVYTRKIQIVLGGNLLYSDKQNTLLLGNVTKDSLSLELKWDKISLEDNWPLMQFEEIQQPVGTFSGDFILKAGLSDLENYSLNGQSELTGLGFHYKENIFHSGIIHFFADENDNIQLKSNINFEENIIHLFALMNLHNFERSEFSFQSRLNNLSFLNRLTGIPLESNDTEIKWSTTQFKQPLPWKADIRSLRPQIDFVQGDSLLVDMQGDLESVRIENLGFYFNGSQLLAGGDYAFRGGDGKINGHFTGNFPDKLGYLAFRQKPFDIKLGLQFKKAKLRTGFVSGILADSKFRFVDGKISSDKNHYYFMFNGDSLSQFTGEIVVWNSLLRGRQLHADLSLPGSVLRNLGLIGDYIPAYTSGSFDGRPEEFSTDLKIQFNKKLNVDINGDFSHKKSNDKFFGIVSVNVGKRIFEGPVDLKTVGNEYHVSADFEDVLKLIISGDKTGDRFSGKLDITGLPIADALAPWYPQIQGGLINTGINFQNLGQTISANGIIKTENVVLNTVGYYNSLMEFSYTDSLFDLKQFDISLNNDPVFKASGQYLPVSEQYRFSAAGNNLDMEYFAHALFAEKVKASGVGDFAMSISNDQENHPFIDFKFRGKQGQIAEIPYTKLGMDITAVDSGQGWLGHIDSLVWFNPDDIDLSVSGDIPFSGDAIFDLGLDFKGDILKYLPKIDDFFTHGRSRAHVRLNISGDLSRPVIDRGELVLVDGQLGMADVINEIDNIRLTVEKKRGSNFVQIKELAAEIENTDIKINAVKSAPESARPLETWYFKDLDLDFGILVLQTSDHGVPLKIYGPMRRDETGYIDMRGKEAGEKFYFAGPVDAPVARGKAFVKNSSITYPFLRSKGKSKPSPAVLFLMTIDWDILAIPASNVHYVNEVNALVDDIVIDMTANPEESELNFRGRIVDKSFKVDGRAVSNSGLLQYLDFDFRVEQFGVNFNPNMRQPEVYGAAYTTIRDTVGGEDFPRDIYLRLYSVDPLTGEDKIGGEWSELHFKLETENLGAGETETDILSYLGYSPDKIKNKATSVGGAVADNLIFRPLVRPIENNLESLLGLDVVRVNAVFTKNIFSNSLNNQLDFSNPGNDIYRGRLQGLAMFSQSQLTLGKYLYPNLYFSYTGRLVNIYDATTQLGLSHQFGLEYRLYRNLLFEVEYDLNRYDYQYLGDPVGRPDFRFRIRHSIHF